MPLKPLFTRRRFLAAAAGSIGALGIYTWRIEPHWLEVVHRPMPVRNLPHELVGKTLLQASDLHVGPFVADDYLLNTFELIKALRPEVVVYTGDLVTYTADFQSHVPAVLSKMATGTLGTFGVLGNHDYGDNWCDFDAARRISMLAENAGVRMLNNEVANVHGLNIVGLGDLWAHQFEPEHILPRLGRDEATVVLSHNPDTCDKPGWDNFHGWILSGHTHGGQCKPPFLPPPMLPVRNRRYTSGEFALSGNRHLYISRGVGHSMRVRFNARPELTVFHLERAAS